MSEENVEIVRRLYEVANNAGLEAVIEFTHPDLEVVPPPNWLGRSTIRGRDEVLEFARQWRDAFEGFNVEAEKFVDSGDHVAVYVRDSGRIPGSDAEVDTRLIHVWTLSGGKAIRWQVFADEREALEAAGLSA